MKKVVGFGELMVRLMPAGYLKLIQADSFGVNYTGAEANVLVSLARFGLPTSLVTKLPQNDVADAALAKMCQFRVGIGDVVYGGDRMGLYYLERGASQRPSKIVYDRKYSAIAQAKPQDFDWEHILEGAGWLHFSGITAALSDDMPAICEAACRTAKAKGAVVSCDLNYRKNLWTPQKAAGVMTRLAPLCDVLIGNEEDAEKCLGMAPEGSDVTGGKLDYGGYARLAGRITEAFGTRQVAFTLRTSISASENGWAGMLYQGGNACFSKDYRIHLVDRVGGGDSFSAGLIYALIQGYGQQEAINFAVAASCLKQAIELDFNLSSVQDVHSLMDGDGSGRVQR